MSAPTYDRAVFRWNGSLVSFMPGDSVAAALYRSGIRTLASTRKRHLPLGFSGTYVQGVLGRVDGRPNVRLDLEPAVIGLEVSAQNTWPGPRFDILRLARLLPSRWLGSGFEHPRIFPGGTRRFQVWERVLWHLAGVAEPPVQSMAVESPLGPTYRCRRARSGWWTQRPNTSQRGRRRRPSCCHRVPQCRARCICTCTGCAASRDRLACGNRLWRRSIRHLSGRDARRRRAARPSEWCNGVLDATANPRSRPALDGSSRTRRALTRRNGCSFGFAARARSWREARRCRGAGHRLRNGSRQARRVARYTCGPLRVDR